MCPLAGENDTGESVRPHLVLKCQILIQTCPINGVYHANAKQSFSVCLCRFTYITACSLRVRCQSCCLRPVLFSLYGVVVETAGDVRLL